MHTIVSDYNMYLYTAKDIVLQIIDSMRHRVGYEIILVQHIWQNVYFTSFDSHNIVFYSHLVSGFI